MAIEIKDKESQLSVEVLPEYGGMIYRINCSGVEILYNCKENLGVNNVMAGGMPVLFPFCSKTSNDHYNIKEKEYDMPFHGFIKDMKFSANRICENEVELKISSNPYTLSHYPYEFDLILKYTVIGNKIKVSSTISNKSGEDMPFYIGWHPYFRASDKTQLDLNLEALYYLDFIENKKKLVSEPIRLSEKLDHVFYPVKNKWSIRNHKEGYSVDVVMDNIYDVVTVYTRSEGFVCVEPWTGLPDCINTKDRLKWVKAGQELTFSFTMNADVF